MVITTLSGYLSLQNPAPATSAPAAAKAAATTAAESRRQVDNAVRDQLREQIRGPNGEQTIIGMPPAGDIIPPQAVDISIAFFVTMAIIIIGLPLARAFARRMDRKSPTPQISNDVSAQLAHLNQAVDAIALEVERITEGQRFTTKLLSEQRDAARQTLPSANR